MHRTLASRLRAFAVFVGLAPILLVHRVAFWLDALLFPHLKHVQVRRPLFIVGVPRSGTTLLHRVLATNTDTFTTFPLWELVLAPALCEKYCVRTLARLDRMFGCPLQRLGRRISSRVSRSVNAIHATSLHTPEEDFLGLLAFDGCFLRVLARPFDKRSWDLVAQPDWASPTRRKRLLRIYRGLLIRHLSFRGETFHLLSKNPSFTPWVEGLCHEFPDARFIALRRDAAESLPSQLSSLRPGFDLFGFDSHDPAIVDRFLNMYAEFWRCLDRLAGDYPPEQFVLGEYGELTAATHDFASSSLERLGYQNSVADRLRLRQGCKKTSGYQSRHRYALADFGLTADHVRGFVHGASNARERSVPIDTSQFLMSHDY